MYSPSAPARFSVSGTKTVTDISLHKFALNYYVWYYLMNINGF